MWLPSLNKKEQKNVRQSSNILDIQTANGIVVWDTRAKVYIKEFGAHLWVHLVEDSPSVLLLGRLAMSLVILSRGCQEKFPSYSKVRKWSNRVVPSTDFSSAWGNFEREREVEDTMLDLLQQVTEGMEEYNASSSTPNAGSDEAWSCRRKTSWWQTSFGCHRCGREINWQRCQE